MDGPALSTTSSSSCCSSLSGRKFLFPSISDIVRGRARNPRAGREVWFPRRRKFVVLAAKEEGEQPKLDQLDQMELKFGRLIGEDPKLTLAKIMARKVNPDVSYIEVEKSFYKNKGKMVEVKEVPFDVSDVKRRSDSSGGLNLVRPVPKKGLEFRGQDKVVAPELKKPSPPVGKAVEKIKRSVPNVILRKPTMFVEDDVDDKPSRSRVSIKPNLTLKMSSDQTKDRFSDMTLLRKPEQVTVDKTEETSGDADTKVNNAGIKSRIDKEEEIDKYTGFTLLQKPETNKPCPEEFSEIADKPNSNENELQDDSILGVQPPEMSNIRTIEEKTVVNGYSDTSVVDYVANSSIEVSLQGKPNRLLQSLKEASSGRKEEILVVNPASFETADELDGHSLTSSLEDADWHRAEQLLKTGGRADVELISSSTRGFVVSFGSLIGFLPYRNLAARWKFIAFESWLRQKGLDPSAYKQNLGIIGSFDALEIDSTANQDITEKMEREISADMKLEDLLRIYDQEKLKFLSSFVGQRIKANVVLADRKQRKFVVSLRPKEKEELIEKKRNLMAKLQIGDVVKCCIKKITYFGIFVEMLKYSLHNKDVGVEDVPALIHQTEVSWDATLDPTSYFKVGQIVDAKVHQLDFMLDRIFLSLKEITPDPLIEALESVVGDSKPLDGRVQAAQPDAEWADVESLIKELQQIEGVQSVTKGRFFLSPGLAPTFQVYMASMFDNQYKLLARSGNKVQEVIVQSSMSKEEMKSTILSCTNRVE